MSSSTCAKCSKDESSSPCSRCRTTVYCSAECQRADWPAHKQTCVAQSTTGVTIFCNKERRPGIFRTVDIGPTHKIHREGIICHLSKVVGLPLVIYRHLPGDFRTRPGDAGLDNVIATSLMISPTSGCAPMEWQQQVGTVTVMRKDGQPLTPEAIETIWMYHDHILDLFNDDPSEARRNMNRAEFKEYCEDYKEARLSNGYNKFQGMSLPL